MAPTKVAGAVIAADDDARNVEQLGGVLNIVATQSPPPNQGARRRCMTCGAPLTIKHNGRPRRFCSDRCWDAARRDGNFRVFGATRYPSQGMPGNPGKTQVKSNICKATVAGPRSPIIQVFGRGICTVPQQVGCAATEPRSLLISNALRAELSAHWPHRPAGREISPSAPPAPMRSTPASASFIDSVASHQGGQT
jgi:hypothetical protein